MDDGEDNDTSTVIVCQGPPCCLLEDDEAVAAQEAGCIWCRRMTLLPSGDWHVEEPRKS